MQIVCNYNEESISTVNVNENHLPNQSSVLSMSDNAIFPESNLFLFNRSEEISHLFVLETDIEISNNNDDETSIIMYGPSGSSVSICQMSKNFSEVVGLQTCSTPILQRRNGGDNMSFGCDSLNTYDQSGGDNMMTCMDESTQVVEAPVLVESTFDTSSCSNLSSDLIILQTGYYSQRRATMINSQKVSYNWVELDTPREIQMCDRVVPDWAMGNQLNLAVVNQVYFAQKGTRCFE